MADLQITLSEEKIQDVLFGDRGMAVLMESVLNEVLQPEISAHLGAEPEEHTDGRRGYRNGSYKRELTTRVGRLELEVWPWSHPVFVDSHQLAAASRSRCSFS